MPFVCDSLSNVLTLNLKSISDIYNRFIDETSKAYWINRMLFSMTDDYKYITEIVKKTHVGKRILEATSSDYMVYGAGVRGKSILGLCRKKPLMFVDRNLTGEIDGVPVIKPELLEYKEGTRIIVSPSNGGEKIKEELINKGFRKEEIIIFQNFWIAAQENIYFDNMYRSYFKKCTTGNIFMDIGCYDGKDSLRAKDYFGKDIKIYAFEPDADNLKKCERIIGAENQIKLYHKGLSDISGHVKLEQNGAGSHISERGNVEIECDTIDNVIGEEEVAYIKMDIEGAEESALIGGERTIRRCKPTLAISIYHRREDFYVIPERILRTNSEYHFAIGHYTTNWADTVLYAF